MATILIAPGCVGITHARSTTDRGDCIAMEASSDHGPETGAPASFPALESTIVADATPAVVAARIEWLRHADGTELDPLALLQLARTTASWLSPESLHRFRCRADPGPVGSEHAILRAVEATRDYLERRVRSSAPLATFREALPSVRAELDEPCDAVPPDPRISAVLAHAFELDATRAVHAEPATGCHPFRTLGFRLVLAPADLSLDERPRSRRSARAPASARVYAGVAAEVPAVCPPKTQDPSAIVAEAPQCIVVQELVEGLAFEQLAYVDLGYDCGDYLCRSDARILVAKIDGTWRDLGEVFRLDARAVPVGAPRAVQLADAASSEAPATRGHTDHRPLRL